MAAEMHFFHLVFKCFHNLSVFMSNRNHLFNPNVVHFFKQHAMSVAKLDLFKYLYQKSIFKVFYET